MSSSSFQNEIPKARINIKLDLHTGGAQKKVELPLKLLVMGDYSNGQEQRPLSEREKLNINKNNFNSVLAEFQPSLKLAVPDTLAGDNTDTAVSLTFNDMKDFEPENVALDNATFRRELENILKDDALSDELRAELAALAPKEG
ncbi:type VI secretion system contractile sheath small subunit [Yersinia pestis]|uniref:type VI secretion system contractile sheath small subunit n=1 Tax=Yersinia pestis TaxID=632 RepID=UPI00062808A6|nr:type VI secretion system contractile sheath small subunit [Yersinia pestis]KKM52856.1 type VI secretion protein [Yersinia pestis subsp. pestis bv. Orientalis]